MANFSKEIGKAGKAVLQPSMLRKSMNVLKLMMVMIGLRAYGSE